MRITPHTYTQMEEEGVPSTTLREVSLLQMLSDSNHIVKYAPPVWVLPSSTDLVCVHHHSNPPPRLLCVEHVEENNKPVLYLVFEYLNTDLKRFMDRNGKGPAHPLPKPLIKVLRYIWSGTLYKSHSYSPPPPQSFMYQLLKGTAHCHKHGVMHRDLKPQNLLVDESTNPHPTLKVADLGLGRQFSIPIKSYTHEVGGRAVGAACGSIVWKRSPQNTYRL